MPSNRVVRVKGSDEQLVQVLQHGIVQIQGELHVTPEFPPEVEAAAEQAAANPRLPELDRTDIEFVTIDPEGAMDLDQALHIERAESGYTVHYAIADLMAFITPGDPVDVESHERGETLYGADSKVPLHPKPISEAAGSLLADQVRPALLWTIDVDATGEGTKAHVERALVKSRAKLAYPEAQKMIDDGSASESLQLLKEIGVLRLEREARRGGVSLPLPEQEVDVHEGSWDLEFRSLEPVELWNAQISLLTGFGAADLMIKGKVGFLRTLPTPDPRDVKRLRRTAVALKVEWPTDQDYPEFIRGLDPTQANHAAMVVACTRLLRGSGYVGFNGEVPEQHEHAGLASSYAHCTAPLRRLCDRYAGEICLALCAGEPVPDWVLSELAELSKTMQRSGQRSKSYERSVLDLVEAGVLANQIGNEFAAVITSVDDDDPKQGMAMLSEPGVEAPVHSDHDLPLGTDVTVRLETADVTTRKVQFSLD